ncbi:MAG TPA: capsule biosynthesis GfcC family protein, partial [Rhodanobacteraceae bacterium]|nr:capsule biosynthesis GfcC family protein [Rhodanobacteraceae bacterium]
MSFLAAPAFAGTVKVQVEGRVGHPGTQTLSAGSRLSDAVQKADVLPDAYPLGAAWLHMPLRKTQLRWKAGLLYEIGVLRGQARLDGQPALMTLAARLERHWRSLPITGRQRMQLLDPRPLQVSTQNHLLADGDRIVYPGRPSTVQVLGAVVHPCTLTFVPMQAARQYRNRCTLAAAADPDWLYIIQPDGHVTRRGIALWNRHGVQTLAPGAVVYVPLDPRVLPASVRDSLNQDAVRFLSTQ